MQSTITEMLNFRKKIENYDIMLKNNMEKTEKINILEIQLNKLNKEFNTLSNSTQIIKNCEVFAREISILKDKTNNLAIQVDFFLKK